VRHIGHAASAEARPPDDPQTMFLRFGEFPVGTLERLSQTKRRERLSIDKRKALDDERRVEGTKAMADLEREQKHLQENRERLKAERLAREATAGPMLYPAPEIPDDTAIDNVRFSTRVRNALNAVGWKTVGEVREASDATLLSLSDLGSASVAHLREALGLKAKK
jgi:DNA-directed RNA polymerase alpha subunit